MTKDHEREVKRNERLLRHTEKIEHVAKHAAILALSRPTPADGSVHIRAATIRDMQLH